MSETQRRRLWPLYAGMEKTWFNLPYIVEFNSIWRALGLCSKLSFPRLIFEGDARSVIKVINGDKENFLWFKWLVDDAREVLQGRPKWRIQYTLQVTKLNISSDEEQVCIGDGWRFIDVFCNFVNFVMIDLW